jgi:hypothetical protein
MRKGIVGTGLPEWMSSSRVEVNRSCRGPAREPRLAVNGHISDLLERKRPKGYPRHLVVLLSLE